MVVTARTETPRENLPGTIHQTASEIQSLGVRCLAVKTDVRKEEEVERLVAQTISEFRKVDILVNNAGVGPPNSMTTLELSIKLWDLTIAVHLRGTFLCTKAVLPYLVEQRSGNIINLSSIQGAMVLEGTVVYGSAKAAIERFTLGLAKELKDYNIAVNAFRPSYTVTEGLKFHHPEADMSDWQTPQMWGKYAALVAAQDAKSLTGMLLTEEDLRERFGLV